jgi:phosphoribosyl 1,2-cyclic phosphate phosphodiesterase
VTPTTSITILGTGTSQGIPVIGCDCKVCQSDNPKDKRLRVSALVQVGDVNIVIDCGPDFRQQMLREKVVNVDAIIFTHEHTDHVIGVDDVRPMNFRTRQNMPLYAVERVQRDLRSRFGYAFVENPYPGAPLLELKTIDKNTPFEIKGIEIIPIEIMHGRLPILGFRIGDFAYLTDMKTIADEEFKKLKGVKTIVIDSLQQREHFSHMTLEESLAFAKKVGAKQTYLTHLSHVMGLHEEVSKLLPENVEIAFDGLKFQV